MTDIWTGLLFVIVDDWCCQQPRLTVFDFYFISTDFPFPELRRAPWASASSRQFGIRGSFGGIHVRLGTFVDPIGIWVLFILLLLFVTIWFKNSLNSFRKGWYEKERSESSLLRRLAGLIAERTCGTGFLWLSVIMHFRPLRLILAKYLGKRSWVRALAFVFIILMRRSGAMFFKFIQRHDFFRIHLFSKKLRTCSSVRFS